MPPQNIRDIYRQQGWNDSAAIEGDIAAGGWKSKVPNSGGGIQGLDMNSIGGSSIDFAKNELFPMQDQAFNDYLGKVNSQAKPLDLFNTLEERAGIPQLRTTASTLSGQVNDLEDTIRRVEGNVNDTTHNSMVTEAQRRGMIEERKKPLQENLSWLGTSLGRVMQGLQFAGQDIGNKVNLALRGQEQELEPYKIRMNSMADRAAMLMTGFNADKQARLDMLTTKLQRQFQLEDREYAEAAQLAKEEREFTRQKEMFSYQQKNTPNPTQMVDLGGTKQLIDSMTGKTIASYNESVRPSSASSSTGFDMNGFSTWYNSTFGGGNKSNGRSAWVTE